MPISAAIELLIALINNANNISQLIASANAAGRTDLTADELKNIVDHDTLARAKLVIAIAEAKAAGK